MNSVFRDIVLARVHAAVGAANAIRELGHKGLQGQLREIFVKDLLRPLLPTDIGLGTGTIITSNGRQSRQQDVVMYDRRILPPLLFEQSVGVFPIESVLYAIEVKSKLTRSELTKSHEAATQFLDLDYLSGTYDDKGSPISGETAQALSVLFAFSTDLAQGGESEIERYQKVYGNQRPAVKALCVVGRGYWYWSKQDKWITWNCKYPL